MSKNSGFKLLSWRLVWIQSTGDGKILENFGDRLLIGY